MDTIHNLTNFAGEHPVITLVVSFAIGFVLGRIKFGKKKAS